MDSSKPGKQRKQFYSQKLHSRSKLMGANLSKELRKSLKKRSISVRKDDRVKVVRGKSRGKSGKIHGVNRKKLRVFIEGLTRKKADGKDIFLPIHPSNLLVLELALGDKKRTGEAVVAVKEKKTGSAPQKESKKTAVVAKAR